MPQILLSRHCMDKGFSYVELIVSLAIFSIMFLPILPLLGQAHANHRYAIERRQAQSHAASLAVTGTADVPAYFTYQRSVITSGDPRFNTNFPHLFYNEQFIVAEVFDLNGNLIGLSVADRIR